MKKILSVVFAFVLVFSLSVTSFAYYKMPSGTPHYSEVDGNTHLGVFGSLNATPEERAFFKEWMVSNYSLLTYDPAGGFYHFFIFRDDFPSTFKLYYYTGSEAVDKNKMHAFAGDGKEFYYKKVSMQNGRISSPITEWKLSRSHLRLGYFFNGSFLSAYSNGYFTSSNYTSFTPYTGTDGFIDYIGKLHITDDGDLFAQEPEEPSDPGGGTVVIPPSDGVYVTYDTSVWLGFLSMVKSSIGTTTNTGLIIFAFIMSILVTIVIVRKFSKV